MIWSYCIAICPKSRILLILWIFILDDLYFYGFLYFCGWSNRILMFTTKYWINFDVNSASRKKKVKWRILWQIPPTLPFSRSVWELFRRDLIFSWLVSFQRLIDHEKQMEIIIVQTPLLGELLCIIYEYWLSCICWCICAIT